MSGGTAHAGWMIDGFQSMVVVWCWTVGVLVHGLAYRSLRRPVPDSIRPSGPID